MLCNINAFKISSAAIMRLILFAIALMKISTTDKLPLRKNNFCALNWTHTRDVVLGAVFQND